ncbi:MAG TPA: hypothetical protein VEX68_19265 [Bryobacteraceae bacterium]|nr:hypothetical protein [Bryobacteraceae bacterium]
MKRETLLKLNRTPTRAGRVLTQAPLTKKVLTQFDTVRLDDDAGNDQTLLESARGMVGAAGFELATPCAQGIGVISNTSIVYFWFSVFPIV